MAPHFTYIPAGDLIASPAAAPEVPGVYVFEIREDGPGVSLLRERLMPLEEWSSTLYVGATGDQLRTRLKQHLRADSASSTMRMSLGLLLREPLSLGLRLIDRKRNFWFSGESRLTDWLTANTVVGFQAHADPFVFEAQLISSGLGMLNVQGKHNSPLATRLVKIKAQILAERDVELRVPSRRWIETGVRAPAAQQSFVAV